MSGDKGMDYAPLDKPQQARLFDPPPSGHQFTDAVPLKEFIESGRAIVTLFSKKSTRHLTYKIKAKSTGTWYVTRLAADNDWIYLGSILDGRGFIRTPATTWEAFDSTHYKAFEWFWNYMMVGRIPTTMAVYHEGRCGMCGRPLTDPISISTGYGPECRQKKYQRPAVSDKV